MESMAMEHTDWPSLRMKRPEQLVAGLRNESVKRRFFLSLKLREQVGTFPSRDSFP